MTSDEDSRRPAGNKPTAAVATGRKTTPLPDPDDGSFGEYVSGSLRGFAAATRKAVMAKAASAKGAIRAVGEARPLAFASEGAVAGDAIIPRWVIHRVVHVAEGIVRKPGGVAGGLPPRAKALAPVAAAMLSIIPVVPAVDYAAEAIMEPTLGRYLGLEFHHHHHSRGDDSAPKGKVA